MSDDYGSEMQPDGGQTGSSTDGTERPPTLSHKGVDEISLSRGWYAWRVEGFGIEESDPRAKAAEEAGENVTIVYAPEGTEGDR